MLFPSEFKVDFDDLKAYHITTYSDIVLNEPPEGIVERNDELVTHFISDNSGICHQN